MTDLFGKYFMYVLGMDWQHLQNCHISFLFPELWVMQWTCYFK